MYYESDNGILKIFPEGRIDSNNAAQAETEIDEIRRANPAGDVVLDLDKLEYISSAGLRVVLRLRKKEQSLKIVNANSDVYEIFDMTGFTEMMPVEKAYRRISVEGCEMIGEGANGKVYRVNQDTIVKVYLNPDSLGDIRRERDLARKAFVLGVPTAISYDIARVGDGYGTVFELLNAVSFAKLINTNPDKIDEYVDMYVNLLKKIHSISVKEGDMPDMKEIALSWAEFDKEYLPKETGEKLVALVAAVPKSDRMLHGDYHVKNVMMQNDEVLLIDMDTLCVGDPVFELGSMFNAYKGFSWLDHSISSAFLGISHETAELIWRKTLEKYLGTTDEKVITAVENKAEIIGFMRLLRRGIRRGGLDDPEHKHEIEFYRNRLTELVAATDSLTIF